MQLVANIDVLKDLPEAYQQILTPEALEFVATLHVDFNSTRLTLLDHRQKRQTDIDRGIMPNFLPETKDVREKEWQVAPTPDDIQDRRVEITGPVDRKMVINALNSGVKVFMADFEDSLAPTWDNVIDGQINLKDAVRKTIRLEAKGKVYELNDEVATLMVRPRGWHLTEKNILIDGNEISASLFDFGLYFYHNAKALLANGSGPYFYLPKLESHLEARLWNDVFNRAQDLLGIPRGTIRATVLIETIMAAYEMEEILYELRDHSAGLNAGRWDYIFSVIKKFSNNPELILPDRAQITMTVPFMRAYTELMIRTCHKRGAHAIGGMSAFIPNRREPEVTEKALKKVQQDKLREATDGCDGTWVAHPDLVETVMDIFDEILGDKPNQKDRLRAEVDVKAEDLLNTNVEDGAITEDGIRLNISVSLQYLAAWLNGSGAVAINNLMEDTATAEISRAQLWQWRKNEVKLADERFFTTELYQTIRQEELEKLGEDYETAAQILDELVLSETFTDFLTFITYPYLD